MGAVVDCAVVRFALQRSLAAATLFGMIRRSDLFFSDPARKELEISQILGMAAVQLLAPSVSDGSLMGQHVQIEFEGQPVA
ncbi:hypothetical protein NKH36_07140 [Mesorhizobium sp. M1312]|uniref:hypothetical protein n=1 Tax=Mesorhizobium sp. M1312 TaxID=2957080 RepID=UPI00333937F4